MNVGSQIISVFFLLLLIVQLSSGDNRTPFLKFRKVEMATHRNGSFSYFGTKEPIVIDGTFPHVTIEIVELLNDSPPTVQFHCVVDPLSNESPIINAQLCLETPSLKKTNCDDALRGGVLLFDKYKFNVTGDTTSGFLFSSTWARDNFPLDATYYCRLGNSNGVIQSNTIEVHDVDSYSAAFSKRKALDPVLREPLLGREFPLSLECGTSLYPIELPNWAKDTFRVPYNWVVCEAPPGSLIELRACFDKSEPIAAYFEHTVLPNGTLVIHELVKSWRPIGILCISSFTRNMIFSAYFQNNNGKATPFDFTSKGYPDNIIPISPLYNHVSIRSGWHARDVISLNALYTANPDIVTTKWTKDDGSLPHQFSPSRHSLVFPTDIKPSYAGTYVLSLKSPYEVVQFKFEVSVEHPPTVNQAPPRNIFVRQGYQAQLNVEFGGVLSSRSVLINGIPINTLSPSNYRESLRTLQEAFPYVGDLNPEIEFPSDTSIRYTVRDLTFTPNSPYGSSHTVTMVGTNALGSERTNTLIRVIPTPEVVRQLSDYSCQEECFNQTTHRFYCDIELAPYTGLRVVKSWELEGQDLERLDPRDNRLAFLEQSNNEIILNIDLDNPTFEELFANVDLSCRFRVFGPETDLFAGHFYEKPLYDTKLDETLNSLLTAHIRKNPSKSRMVNVASISWIVAVVVAVLILLIVAVLAVCIVMRNKGKSYMVEREERIRGNDPEKEFRERGAFPVYERSDEVPIPGCNQSLEDTFQEVGSDDEGELDYYGMDPGNFNETGSFIGEYTKSSRQSDNRLGTTPSKSVGPVQPN